MSHLWRRVLPTRGASDHVTRRNAYLEETRISEVRRLAVRLGVSTEALLQASFSLSQDGGHLNVEGVSDLPQDRNPDVSFPV
jgi:hypothetical protein